LLINNIKESALLPSSTIKNFMGLKDILLCQVLATIVITAIVCGSCKVMKGTAADNNYPGSNIQTTRPRVIVTTDIGGTDPDDFQSMIHYLMYADRFQTEGLVSSPFGGGTGRKTHILQMLDLYEKDYPKLKAHSSLFPTPDQLRSVTKQGNIEKTNRKGWSVPSEGSDWIIKCARKKSEQPLWVLAWGGLEEVAQALHDAPDISKKIRIYWIGGPNKKWGVQAYNYIVSNFPDLWMIESNSTYRGWTIDGEVESGFDNKTFYEKYIRRGGAMGADFGNYYKGMIKMGDSPSVGYLLFGNPDDPASASWGGSYIPLKYSARRIFERETTLNDEVPVFGIMEWVLRGLDRGAAIDTPAIWVEIDKQKIEGFYEGNGLYRIRFVPKEAKKWSYKVISDVPELNGKTGQFTSTDPWPGVPHKDNISPLNGWWSDRTTREDYLGSHQGGNTIYRWRKTYLEDWAKRWLWLSSEQK
jgi:hypothetical protein